jgi:hypothetical protein
MKVYVVTVQSAYEGGYVSGVYATLDAARNAANLIGKHSGPPDDPWGALGFVEPTEGAEFLYDYPYRVDIEPWDVEGA